MNGRDEQTDCRQQRKNTWRPPPERMRKEQEGSQIAQEKLRGGNFGTKVKNEIVHLRNPPPPRRHAAVACCGHRHRPRGVLLVECALWATGQAVPGGCCRAGGSAQCNMGLSEAHRGRTVCCAKSRPFWTRFARWPKVTTVTTVFPYKRVLRFFLSPKTQAMGCNKRHFPLKIAV